MRVTAETTICVTIGGTEFRRPIIFTIEVPDGASERDIDQAVFDARKNSYLSTIDQEIVEIK